MKYSCSLDGGFDLLSVYFDIDLFEFVDDNWLFPLYFVSEASVFCPKGNLSFHSMYFQIVPECYIFFHMKPECIE